MPVTTDAVASGITLVLKNDRKLPVQREEELMTSIDDRKRLNDDELEAVAGGMTPLDPMLLNSIGHGFNGLNLNQSITDAHAAAAPGIMNLTPIAAAPVHAPADVAHTTPDSQPVLHNVVAGVSVAATLPLTGSLNMTLPPPAPPITVMHFDNTQGAMEKVTPTVTPVDQSDRGPNPTLGGALGKSWGNF